MITFVVTFKDDLYSTFQPNFLFHSLLHHGNYCALRKMVRNLFLSLHSFMYLLVHLCFHVFSFSHCSTRFIPYITSDFPFAVAPTIQSGPQTAAVRLNASAVLECAAEGVPTPRVTWRKDGAVFTGNNTRYCLKVSINIFH